MASAHRQIHFCTHNFFSLVQVYASELVKNYISTIFFSPAVKRRLPHNYRETRDYNVLNPKNNAPSIPCLCRVLSPPHSLHQHQVTTKPSLCPRTMKTSSRPHRELLCLRRWGTAPVRPLLTCVWGTLPATQRGGDLLEHNKTNDELWTDPRRAENLEPATFRPSGSSSEPVSSCPSRSTEGRGGGGEGGQGGGGHAG